MGTMRKHQLVFYRTNTPNQKFGHVRTSDKINFCDLFATYLRLICGLLFKDIIDRPANTSPFDHVFGDKSCQLLYSRILGNPQYIHTYDS